MTAQAPKHSGPSRLETLARRFLVPVGIAAGATIFILAFVLADTDTGDDVIFNDPAIEALLPVPGSEVLRQSQVGIDLASGFDAELVINGVPIPRDQVNILRNAEDPDQSAEEPGVFATTINRFLYQPLEGRAVPELKGDENCVVATFWPLADPSDVRTTSWCFTVA